MGRSPFDDDDDSLPGPGDFARLLKDRAPRTAIVLGAAQAAYPWVTFARNTYKSRKLYTIRVNGGFGSDGLYDELHDWVLTQLPSEKRKAVVAYLSMQRTPQVHAWDDDFLERHARPGKYQNVVRFRYDGERAQTIVITDADGNSHRVKVTAAAPNFGGGGKKADVIPQICFSVYSLKARDAMNAQISEIARKSQDKTRTPKFRMLNKYDEWDTLDDLPPRILESVILPSGQQERIVGDIERFLSMEETYVKRCSPWHRCHLYTGMPGTGKSSMAQALAAHFALDIWYLPLADMNKDADLLTKVSGIRGKSVLLLEDVDRVDLRATIGALLNAMDGLATPHGLITIMTANHPEKLDPALVRSGRTDLIEEFTFSGAAEAARLVSRWYDERCPLIRGDLQMSASDISEVCKGLDSAAAAAEVLNGTSPEAVSPQDMDAGNHTGDYAGWDSRLRG